MASDFECLLGMRYYWNVCTYEVATGTFPIMQMKLSHGKIL